jgi:hypothetical protein
MDKTRQKTGHARHMQSCKRAIMSSGTPGCFANQWVEASADEIEDENYDFSKRDERIHKIRAAAVKEIWAERGFEGVTALLSGSGAPGNVGRYLGAVHDRRDSAG